jgi:hypothetical protein
MTAADVAPRTIGAVLRETGDGADIVMKDIYNARQKIRADALNGRTPIQALISHFSEDDFVWSEKHDGHGHVTHLFFSYKKALDLYRFYPEVLLIDSTYKTNRFNMPLCIVVGITAVNTTFFVRFAFLRSEQQVDFTWALQQLSAAAGSSHKPMVVVTDRDLALMNSVADVFPSAKHLLCTWHIDKNVKARCWPFFRDAPTTSAGTPTELWDHFEGDWKTLVRSLTQGEYNRNRAVMKARHRRHTFSLNYVETVWLRDHKERFVYAWTLQHLHLGTVVTSRVESAHSLLKRYINVSLHSVLHVFY